MSATEGFIDNSGESDGLTVQMEGAVALCRLREVGMRPCVRLIPVPVLTPVPPKANLPYPEPGPLVLFNIRAAN